MVSPDKFPQQLQQARSFSDEGQPGKAAQIYTSILNQHPDHFEANYSLVLAKIPLYRSSFDK
jgi:hypothetical protein